MKWEANHSFPFSRFRKALVFVGGGAADVAEPCEFRHIQLLTLGSGCQKYD